MPDEQVVAPQMVDPLATLVAATQPPMGNEALAPAPVATEGNQAAMLPTAEPATATPAVAAAETISPEERIRRLEQAARDRRKELDGLNAENRRLMRMVEQNAAGRTRDASGKFAAAPAAAEADQSFKLDVDLSDFETLDGDLEAGGKLTKAAKKLVASIQAAVGQGLAYQQTNTMQQLEERERAAELAAANREPPLPVRRTDVSTYVTWAQSQRPELSVVPDEIAIEAVLQAQNAKLNALAQSPGAYPGETVASVLSDAQIVDATLNLLVQQYTLPQVPNMNFPVSPSPEAVGTRPVPPGGVVRPTIPAGGAPSMGLPSGVTLLDKNDLAVLGTR